MIEDNGKGLESNGFKKREGIITAYQRMYSILNQYNKDKASLEIKSGIKGVEVLIKIPINYKYQL